LVDRHCRAARRRDRHPRLPKVRIGVRVQRLRPRQFDRRHRVPVRRPPHRPGDRLYYNRAHYYSPSLGRFLQTDPSGTNGGVNRYAYTANDPVNRVDPAGRAWMSASSVNAYGQMNIGAFSAANDNAFFCNSGACLAPYQQ
jgi:RHS repeat-associated protein